MASRPRSFTHLVLLLVLLLASSGAAQASPRRGANETSKHALLIGVGAYPPPVTTLDGPPHDVDALRRRLVGAWGFDAANVAVLIDAEATRGAILEGLDRLADATRPGDYVFLYYSGHGTSAYDRELRLDAEIGKWTGALIPYDYGASGSASAAARLIVGSRDLRPRLAALDRDREVFVVFDTCFAGNSVRSISGRPVRWSELPARPASARPARSLERAEDPFDADPISGADPIFGAATSRPQPYPYQGLIYLAAARKFERAEDLLPSETSDGRPHGALTHALLRGLAGAADVDGDDRLSYRELYTYVHDQVRRTTRQQPQLLYPERRPELVGRPVFEHRSLPSPAAATVQALVDLAYPRQHFSLALELAGGAGSASSPAGVLYRGQRFEVTVRVGEPAVLLLLNVDQTGTVSVLYPAREGELGRTDGLRETFEVVAPYGVEYLKLFAFRRAPEGLEPWLGRTVEAGSPELGELIAWLSRPGVESAETRLELVTAGGPASPRGGS